MHEDDFDRHTKEHDTPSLGGGELHEQITIGCPISSARGLL